MIPTSLHHTLLAGLKEGRIVPYLGPGVLADVRAESDGRPMPATSEQLILAMNEGKPMAPKLMYEFPRAAMHVELKRGRQAVTQFLVRTYRETAWTRAAIHDWLAALRPPYVIDINRDTQLQASYAAVPHLLITGIARIGGTQVRYKLWRWDGAGYHALSEEATIEDDVPVLFKPMGTPLPEAQFIASDADYVDYITELMGGFAIPPFLKQRRRGLRYLFLGMRFTRDTERMVASDLIYGADTPTGWALIAEPTEKEKRFLARQGIEWIAADGHELLDLSSEAKAC